jgi:S-adenosylmethionine synthetase
MILKVAEVPLRGHPDKLADQISDKLLDLILVADPYAHVALDTIVKGDQVILVGEVTGDVKLKDYAEDAIPQVIRDVGYSFDPEIRIFVSEQSSEINKRVGRSSVKAGDQGFVYGYATNETYNMMPLEHEYARRIARNIHKRLNPLGPDGKVQLAVENSVLIHEITVSVSHPEEYDPHILEQVIKQAVLEAIVSDGITYKRLIVNPPDGIFIFGGPHADTGITGRKIISDTYGGRAPHGGGAFSGKDGTKVDRSGAYLARYMAKKVIKAGLTDECLVMLGYEMGRELPNYLDVKVSGKPKLAKSIREFIYKNCPLSVEETIQYFDMRNPKWWSYYQTAQNGHFGYGDFPWEQV